MLWRCPESCGQFSPVVVFCSGQSGTRLESGKWIVCALLCSSLRRLNKAKCLDLRVRSVILSFHNNIEDDIRERYSKRGLFSHKFRNVEAGLSFLGPKFCDVIN